MKYLNSLFLLLLAAVSPALAQESRLTLLPQQPVAGQSISVTYDAKGGPLGGIDQLVGIAYTYDNYRWHVSDVDLTSTGNNTWQGTLRLPEDCGLVVLKVQHTLDNHHAESDTGDPQQGYVFQVYNQNGRLMPGAEIGRALIKTPSLINVIGYEGVHGYFSEDRAEPSAEELKAALQAELKLSKKPSPRLLAEERLLLPRIYSKDECHTRMLQLAQTLEKQKDLTEDDWMNIYYIYNFSLNDHEKGKQIEQQILEMFPYGRIARRTALQLPFELKGEAYLEKTRQLRKDFPVAKYYENPDAQGFIFNNFYRRLAQELFDTQRYDELSEVLGEMNSGMLSDAFIHQPKQSLKFPDRDPKQYYDISKKYIEEMERKVDFAANEDGLRVTPRQSAAERRLQLGFYRTVVTEIARRAGRYQEGVDIMDAIPENMRFNYDPTGNEAYIFCQQQLGHNDAALKAAFAAAANGKMSPYIVDFLHKHYDSLAEKPGTSFEDYLYSLKSEEAKAETLRHVREGLVSDAYTPFDVADFDGGRVKSADFAADDIVVLDFWATWCAPCCAALVGMQMAVEKYLNDPKVKFYFVDTQDRATPELLHKYWAEKGYHDMPVVFDNSRPGTNDKALLYSDMFPNASGIPQKAILKGGKVRYRAGGYMGSPSGLKDEISAVIDILKAEK